MAISSTSQHHSHANPINSLSTGSAGGGDGAADHEFAVSGYIRRCVLTDRIRLGRSLH